MLDEIIYENLMNDPAYKRFYKKHLKKLENQRPLCRVTESIKPAIQDYWRSAMARAFAEMGK